MLEKTVSSVKGHMFDRIAWALMMTIVLVACADRTQAEVSVREDSLVIPTYLVKPPNPMPRFYEGRVHQGVQRRIYPYPMNDNLTRVKEDRSYHIIYMENEYLRIGVMPGLGGRIFEAIDKTNGYHFFYRQHVIKPSLIGMVGYWISGSNAWGFPHHHGPNTVRPMDYRIESHDDGSATVWIANTDLRHRMRILIGYTIHPGSSLVEMTVRPHNRTPLVHSMLFWANPSVHVNTDYQVIFPPSVEYVTQHAKREMTSWPIADGRYNRYDYSGVDISWWKNIGVPSSFFSWDPQEDFFGGYDHGKQAGTVWVGNHHICPGMKFWAWGNNPAGDRTNAELTDTDGHYIELMVGAYTDNQPDYSWLQPYESKDVVLTWFPIRSLGGIKEANRNGALNLELSDDSRALVRLNTTRAHDTATIVVEYDNREILRENVSIGPDKPYSKDVALPSNSVKEKIHLTLLSRDGETLISYQPKAKRGKPKPEALAPPPPPEEIPTVEQLYYTGLRLDQFYNASVDPYPYYEEALRRDPGDYRTNTQLGVLHIKRKMWGKAEQHLQTAVDRVTANYTRPKDCEALYYLGIVKRALGKTDEAYDLLYDATWDAAWHTPAYYQLAEVDCQRGDYETALAHLDRSLTTQSNNLRALDLKVVALRKLGRKGKAMDLAASIVDRFPLDHQSRNELYLLKSEAGGGATEVWEGLTTLMRDEIQSYLELATDYSNCGFYQEAIDILSRLESKGSQFPMLSYYLGYYWEKLGDNSKALSYYQAASGKPHQYRFPFRTESVEVLEHAFAMNPKDAKALYYLGNLLYEHDPERAVALWEKSRQVDDGFYMVHRNLGWAYERDQQDVPKALASYQKAFSLYNKDARLMYELDVLSEQAKEPPQQRYDQIFKRYHETAAERSETLLREVSVLVAVGKYDEALEILANNEFPQFEGSTQYRDAFQDANLLRGQERAKDGDYQEALQYYQAALSLSVGRFGRSRQAQVHYRMGDVLERLGDTAKANEHYRQATETVDAAGSEYLYEVGLAYQKLGDEEKARKAFDGLIATAKGGGRDFFRQFERGAGGDARTAHNHYLLALAYLGTDRVDEARAEFQQAVQYNPSHVWARVRLAALGR